MVEVEDEVVVDVGPAPPFVELPFPRARDSRPANQTDKTTKPSSRDATGVCNGIFAASSSSSPLRQKVQVFVWRQLGLQDTVNWMVLAFLYLQVQTAFVLELDVVARV